jgi:hypothetical protein
LGNAVWLTLAAWLLLFFAVSTVSVDVVLATDLGAPEANERTLLIVKRQGALIR